MSRTPIPAHLIHDPKEVKENAEKFDQLCSVFAAVARPYIKADLASAKGITEEKISEATNEFASYAVSSWLQKLSNAAENKKTIKLQDTLVPALTPEGKFPDMMRAFAHRLMDSRESMDLPLKLKLEKD